LKSPGRAQSVRRRSRSATMSESRYGRLGRGTGKHAAPVHWQSGTPWRPCHSDLNLASSSWRITARVISVPRLQVGRVSPASLPGRCRRPDPGSGQALSGHRRRVRVRVRVSGLAPSAQCLPMSRRHPMSAPKLERVGRLRRCYSEVTVRTRNLGGLVFSGHGAGPGAADS
jgi:hypothetical protein